MKKQYYAELDADDKMKYSIWRYIISFLIITIILMTSCCQTEMYYRQSIEKQKMEYTQKYIETISNTVKDIFVLICK